MEQESEIMVEFLFGWIYKGSMFLSTFDLIMACIEILVVINIVCAVATLIDKIRKWRKRKWCKKKKTRK